MTDPLAPPADAEAILELELAAPRLPTPNTDPNGLAAGAAGAVSAVLLALGATDVIAAKWSAALIAVVAVAGPLWARLKTWPPAKVWLEAAAARAAGGRDYHEALEAAAQQAATAATAAQERPERPPRPRTPRRRAT